MEDKLYKANSYLYCIKPVVMKNGKTQGKAVTKIGKNYKVLNILNKSFYITDETGQPHGFGFEDHKEWFIYSEKIIRGLNKIVNEIIENDDIWE